MIRLPGFDPWILAKRLFLSNVWWKPQITRTVLLIFGIIVAVTVWILSSVIYNRVVWYTGYWETSVPIDKPSVTSQETGNWFCSPSIKVDISHLGLWFPRKTVPMFSSNTWQHFRNTQSSKHHELKDLRNYIIIQLGAILDRDEMLATRPRLQYRPTAGMFRLLPVYRFFRSTVR